MEHQATLSDIAAIYRHCKPVKDPKPSKPPDYDKPFVEMAFGSLDASIPLNIAEVRQSSIHGRGVFAKRKIDKDGLVTLYPAHYVILRPLGRGIGGEIGVINSGLALRRRTTLTIKQQWDYSFDVTDYYQICGHPDLTDDPAFLGHMINDGAKGHSTKTKYDPVDERMYTRVTMALRNVGFRIIGGLCVGAVATKEISAGEEIVTTYGYDYWTSANTI